MKTVLLLGFFSFMAFAGDAVSPERKAFLKDALVEAYGQEVVDAAKMKEEAQSQIIEVLPEKLLECALNDSDATAACNEVIAAAKEAGITQSQVEEAIDKIDSEKLQDALAEKVRVSMGNVYGDDEAADEQGEVAEMMAELPEALSECRENDSGVSSLIPDVFQDSLCSEVITDAKEAGISYAMVKGALEGLAVDESGEAEKKKKPRTVAKP